MSKSKVVKFNFLFLLLILFSVWNFSDAQTIQDNKIIIEFPVKLDTTFLVGDYEFRYNPNHPFFKLTFNDLDSLVIGGLVLCGSFDITLSYEYGLAKQLNDSEFLFKVVFVKINSGSAEEYFNLLNQKFLYSISEISDCKEYQALVDTENKIAFSFNYKDNTMNFWDPTLNFK